MKRITFRIIGNPAAKGRPRFARRGNFVKTYTPKKTESWENFIRLQAIRYKPESLIDGPIKMQLDFYLPRPKSLSKKVIYHAKKPDIENLAKSVLDALQGIIYTNHSRVCQLVCRKKYSTDGYGVLVDITEI